MTRKLPCYIASVGYEVVSAALQVEPLELNFSELSSEELAQVYDVIDTSASPNGDKIIRVKSQKSDGTPCFKKIGTVDTPKLSKKNLRSYTLKLSISQPLVRSLNQVCKEGFNNYRYSDTTNFLVHESTGSKELSPGHAVLHHHVHQKFTHLLDVVGDLKAKRIKEKGTFTAIPQIFSSAAFIAYAVMGRIGIVNAMRESLGPSKAFYAGTILDVVCCYLTQQTTRLGSSHNTYNQEVLSLTGKIIDQRTIAEIANTLVLYAREGFLKLTRTVNGEEVNLVSSASTEFELITSFFENAITFRFNNYLLDMQVYARNVATWSSGKSIDDSWLTNEDVYNAIPVADEMNLEQMKLAYLGVTKAKGRTLKGFFQPKPAFRLPKVRRGRPTKEEEKARAIQREAEEWAKSQARDYAKRIAAKNRSDVNDAQRVITNMEANQLHDIVEYYKTQRLLGKPENLFRSLPIKDTHDKSGNEVLQTPKRVLIDITTFKSDAEGISLTEIGHLGSDRKNWENVLKVLLAVDIVTGSVVSYRLLHGNISDQSIFENVIGYLKQLGYSEIYVIADRGFSKELTHKFLSAHGVKFVFMANNKTDLQKKLRGDIIKDYEGDGKHFTLDEVHAGQFIRATTITYQEAGYTNAQGELIDEKGNLILDDNNNPYVVQEGYDKLTTVVFFDPGESAAHFFNKRVATLGLLDIANVNPRPDFLDSLDDEAKLYAKYLKWNKTLNRFELNEEKFFKFVLTEKTNACITNIATEDARLVLDLCRLRWHIKTIFRQVKHSFGENESIYVQRDGTGAVKLGCLFTAVAVLLYVKVNEARYNNSFGSQVRTKITSQTYADCDYFNPANFRKIRLSGEKLENHSGTEPIQGTVLRALAGIENPTIEFYEQVRDLHTYKSERATVAAK